MKRIYMEGKHGDWRRETKQTRKTKTNHKAVDVGKISKLQVMFGWQRRRQCLNIIIRLVSLILEESGVPSSVILRNPLKTQLINIGLKAWPMTTQVVSESHLSVKNETPAMACFGWFFFFARGINLTTGDHNFGYICGGERNGNLFCQRLSVRADHQSSPVARVEQLKCVVLLSRETNKYPQFKPFGTRKGKKKTSTTSLSI